MTDLLALAQKISSLSPNVRAFAVEAAKRIQALEQPATAPPAVSNHLGLLRYEGDIATWATRHREYQLLVVSQGNPTSLNPRTLVYANGLKIRRPDDGSGVHYPTLQTLGYDTGVDCVDFPANFAKVQSQAYRDWFAGTVAAGAVAQGAYGLFLDDLSMQPRLKVGDKSVPVSDTSSPSCQQIFGVNLAAFQDAMVALCAAVGAACHQHGLKLYVNLNAYVAGVQDSAAAELAWVKRVAGSIDGAVQESYLTLRDGTNTPRTTAQGVLTGWSTLAAQVEQVGVDFVAMTYGPLETALYGYASVLSQVRRPGSCFFWVTDTDPAGLLGRYTGTATVDFAAGRGVVA